MQPATAEQQRQRYLVTMGITPWLPVRALPGAASSPEWDWQRCDTDASPARPAAAAESVQASAQPVASARAGSERAAPTAAIQQLLAAPASVAADARPEPAVVAEKQPSPSETQHTSAAEEPLPVPRFRLAFVGYRDCLVVTDLPMDVIQGFTGSHQKLLDRILASVGLGEGEPRIKLFAWPVVSSAHVDQSAPVARAGVNGIIRRLQNDNGLPVLLLGSQAAEFVLQPGEPERATSPAVLNDRPVLVSSSLNELMRVPGQKRELWLQLLKLKPLLSDSSAC